MPIPAWLNTRPVDFAEASQAGLNSGLAAARIWQSAQEENARLAQAQRNADLAAKIREERDQQDFILQQQKNLSNEEYQRAVIGQRRSQAEETAKTAQARAQAAMENYQRMQQIQLLRAQAEKARLMQPKYFSRKEGIEKVGPDGTVETIYSAPKTGDDLASLLNEGTAPPKQPGIISRAASAVQDFMTGGPSIPKSEAPPFAEGDTIRNKKDGKLYVVRNGLPVLVDDAESDDTGKYSTSQGSLPGDSDEEGR